jgi:CHAT domain-containing protein
MKARAKSVLGTLWPVDDQATRTVMEQFYAGLEATHESKVDALRAAQLQLLHDPKTADPFYWAPFVLIGNWL